MTRSSGHEETFSPISGSGRVSLLPFLFVRILQSTLTENSILTTRSSEHEETFSQISVSGMVSLLPLRQNISFFFYSIYTHFQFPWNFVLETPRLIYVWLQYNLFILLEWSVLSISPKIDHTHVWGHPTYIRFGVSSTTFQENWKCV